MDDMTHDEAVQYMRENGRNLSMYYGARDNATTAARLIVEHVESLQSQLAAERERADGLQSVVDAAKAQKPVAWMTADGRVSTDETKRSGMASTSRVNFNIPLYAAPVPAQPVAPVAQAAQAEGVCQACGTNIALTHAVTIKHENDRIAAAQGATTDGGA